MALGRSPREAPQERLQLVWTGFWILTGLLVARLLDLQVIRNVYYLKAAEKNRTQMIFQTGPRGRILDRNGKVLASNRPAFSAIFLPGKQSGETLVKLAADLAPQLGAEQNEIFEELRDSVKTQVPVRLAENLPPRTMFRLSELTPLYPGLDLIVEARRYYPYGAFASHLLGYLGRIDPKEWPRLRLKDYRPDSRVGKSGVEQMLEEDLRGVDGGLQLEVDAQGRLKGLLQKVPWSPGGDATLTIDADIQKAAEEGLKASHSGAGAVVALDPRNGDILALASAPDFDPNLLLVPKDEETAVELKALPEFNLAIQGTFAPGSTFKAITGAALFNDGRMSPNESFYCSGHYSLKTRTFMCWKKDGHGRRAWREGIADSCDVYFYNAGLKVGGAAIEKYEKLFRLGQVTHIPLKGEKKGHIFGPLARGSRGWYEGDTLNQSIGQGEILVTPIQIASVYMAIANHGTFYRPAFIRSVKNAAGDVVFERSPEVLGKIELKESTWDLLHDGLRAVITEGTGRRVDVPGLDVWGKTGTAQNQGKDHAWFAAFAGEPGQPPRLALAVLVQFGGHGSEAAGPIARKIVDAAFKDYLDAHKKQQQPSKVGPGLTVPQEIPAETIPMPMGQR